MNVELPAEEVSEELGSYSPMQETSPSLGEGVNISLGVHSAASRSFAQVGPSRLVSRPRHHSVLPLSGPALAARERPRSQSLNTTLEALGMKRRR